MFQPGPRIFISYSRSELSFARKLRKQLIDVDLTVWQDVQDIGSGLWWSQIDEAIAGRASVEHLVLIVSSAAIESNIVEREWRLAWREGKAVSAVIPPGLKRAIDFSRLPAWMRAEHFYDLAEPEQKAKLIEVLKAPAQAPKRLMMAPPLPEAYVQRTAEFAQLKSVLMDRSGEAVAVTAALRGAGGFGKTALATAVARDPKIQDAFYEGVLWVTLGENPDLLAVITDLIYSLTRERTSYTEINTAADHLTKRVLAHRCCLLVIDDAWQQVHLRPLLDGAPATTRLIVTRRDDILPAGAPKVVVDAMTAPEAVELLASNLSGAGPKERVALTKLATGPLGEWPILLRLANGFLRFRVGRGDELGRAVEYAAARLSSLGLVAFDRNSESERASAIEKTVRVSLDLLAEFDVERSRPHGFHLRRYEEFAVFPANAHIPIATIARLWQRTAGMRERESEELIERLDGLALLQALDLARRTIRIHDVMRAYLTGRTDRHMLMALHGKIAAAYAKGSPALSQTAEELNYRLEHMPFHLDGAGQLADLHSLLLDPQWMLDKIAGIGIQSLLKDYNAYAARDDHRAVHRTLLHCAYILARDSRQLPVQLLGRIHADGSKDLEGLRLAAALLVPDAAIVPKTASLASAGSLIRRFEETRDKIIALEWFDGERVLIGFKSGLISLFDITVGQEQGRFASHGHPISRLFTLDQDRFVCIFDRGSVGVGHASSESLTIIHERGDLAEAWTVGRFGTLRLLAGRADGTLELWTLSERPPSATPRLNRDVLGTGRTTSPISITMVEADRFAVGWTDGTIDLWRLSPPSRIARLNAPPHFMKSLLCLGGRYLICGRARRQPETPNFIVMDLSCNAIIDKGPDQIADIGQLIPAGPTSFIAVTTDNAIRLWDVAPLRCRKVIGGHMANITAVTGSLHDKLLSSDVEGHLALWETTAAEPFSDVGDGIAAIELAEPNKAIAISNNGRIAEWDRAEATQIRQWEAHRFHYATATTVVDDATILVGDSRGQLFLVDTRAAKCKTIYIKELTRGAVCGIAVFKGGVAYVSFENHSPALLDLGTFQLIGSETHDHVRRRRDIFHHFSHVLEGMPENSTFAIRAQYFLENGYRLKAMRLIDELFAFFDEKHLHVIDIDTGRMFWSHSTASVSAVALLPSLILAIGRRDGGIECHHLLFKRRLSLAGHDNLVAGLAYVDMHRLLSISHDRSIRLWDVERSMELARLEGDAAFLSLRMDHAGSQAIVGDALGRLHLLNFRPHADGFDRPALSAGAALSLSSGALRLARE
jgi:WD40 repeat protein